MESKRQRIVFLFSLLSIKFSHTSYCKHNTLRVCVSICVPCVCVCEWVCVQERQQCITINVPRWFVRDTTIYTKYGMINPDLPNWIFFLSIFKSRINESENIIFCNQQQQNPAMNENKNYRLISQNNCRFVVVIRIYFIVDKRSSHVWMCECVCVWCILVKLFSRTNR